MKFNNNKKGVELTLQTIVIFIILVVVLVVMIFFFVNHYGDNLGTLWDVGNSSIQSAIDQ